MIFSFNIRSRFHKFQAFEDLERFLDKSFAVFNEHFYETEQLLKMFIFI